MLPAHTVLPVLLFFAAGLAGASTETPAPVADGGYFENLPLVLTPSRLPQSIHEAPAAVTVLDRELIRATGYRDIARLFRLVPGMQVGDERGGIHWVSYHGLGNDAPVDLQVLVDGRALYSPSTIAGVEWSPLAVDIDEIERIEIVRGTDAVSYGPNAFLGVVNIITRHASDEPGYRLSTRVGDSGIIDQGFAWSGGDDRHALRATVSSSRDNGYRGLYDDSRSQMVGLRSDSRISDKDELSLHLSGSRIDRGEGYPDSTLGSNPERMNETRTANFHAQWRHDPTAGEEILLNFFRNESSARDEWVSIQPRPDLGFDRQALVPINRNYRGVRNSVEGQHRFAPSKSTQLVWGAEARHEWIDSPFMFHDRRSVTDQLFRLFGNLEQRFSPAWTANIGGMVAKYSEDRSRWSPRLFLNWKTSADMTFRAGYARAWRDVNNFERNSDVQLTDSIDGRKLFQLYLPNPTLRPSRIDSVEFGYLGRLQPGNTTIDLRVFRERITDLIVRTIQPLADDNQPLAGYLMPTRFDNLDSTLTLTGVEYQVRSRPRPGTQLILSHTLISRRTINATVADRIAPYSASLSWLQEFGADWSGMITLLRMGSSAGADGYVLRTPYRAAAYTTVDFRLARRLRAMGHNLEIALTGTNLGPRHQEIADRSEQFLHPDGPVNPVSRMIFLSLRIDNR